MKRSLVFLAILLAPGAAHAASTPPTPSAINDAELRRLLAPGEEVEARVDGDLNGDGAIDTALVVAKDDDRTLRVFFAPHGGAHAKPILAGQTNLPVAPLDPADMAIRNGTLAIKDLTGGTTATSTTYRFRGETAEPKLRLIGLDATFYSRTFAHDGAEMSWNLLTGDIITSRLKVAASGSDAGYDKVGAKRARRPASTVYLENTPDPEEELSLIMQGE